MAYRLPANLHRNRHGALYFRVVVPEDIRHAVGQREIYRSLNTCGVREAAHAAQTLKIAFWAAFSDLRSHLMLNNEINAQSAPASRLMDLIKHTREKNYLREKIEELEERVLEERFQRLKAEKQHRRELAIALYSPRSTPVAPKSTGMPLSEAVAEYLAGQTKPTTKKTYKGRLDHAVKFFTTDKDARHIEQADLSAYAKHVLDTISNATTAGFYITTLGGLLNHFRIREGWGPALTTKKLIPKKETPDSADRDGFTLGQMAAIFRNAASYRDAEQHKYWATVAPAFLGCRIEELAQVNLHTDLRQTDGNSVWYLDLNASPDPDGVVRKSMKNKASWRCVPIHSALKKLGFVDYLLQEREAGFSRPFERGWGPLVFEGETKPKWSHYVTNWGGRELKKLAQIAGFAITDHRLSYFHSMRHTFSQCMGRAGVSPEVCEAVLGHAYAGSERERYHKLKSDPEQLSRGVEMGLVDLAGLATLPRDSAW